MAEVLKIDFDALTVAEIDFIEDELNERLRPVLGDKIVSFNDVIAQFRDEEPVLKIPQGKILRVLALLQLRRANPDATWEQAGELELTAADAPKAPVTVPVPDLTVPVTETLSFEPLESTSFDATV